MKQLLQKNFVLLLLYTAYINTTDITFINDSMSPIFLTDHLTYGALVSQQGQYRIKSKEKVTIYLYTQTNTFEQTFTLNYRVVELQSSSQPITINYHDLTSKSLEIKYPKQFAVTHQTRILFEQQHEQRMTEIKNQQQAVNQQTSQVVPKTHSKQSMHQAHSPMHTSVKDGPQAVLDSIITQYNQMLEQKQNKGISTEALAQAHRTHPKKPPIPKR